ncbi:MAG: tRNA uridine 5-carboxymethylaminomethyl modification enzyme GidA [Dehalococcoidia bacterium]|nr:tRNA uridine 5-carboxymethylaminomethyl modification enzyme GidA [Dehalococcoidia bacterium]
MDCTGTRGGIAVCNKYGKGCVMCLVRCFAYGDRVGVVEKAGGKTASRVRPDGTPGMLSSAVTLFKDTLAPELKARIEKEGLVIVPLPKELVDYDRMKIMGGQRSRDFVENIILADIGPVAKCFGLVYMEQDNFRKVPGFENVQVEDPRASKWNHIGHIGIASRDISLKVKGFENLFCAGEKSGQTSVDGVIITGYLAGHNAARQAFGVEQPLVLPRSLAIGDFMAFVTKKLETGEALKGVYRMARGEYWERMQKIGLYTEDVALVKERVAAAGLSGVLARSVKK